MELAGVEGVPFPPQPLIFMDANAATGYRAGLEIARHLDEVGVNVADGLLLDIGCGYGRLAYALLGRRFAGKYIGVDILADRIAFLRESFSTRRPSFEFHHIDVKNDRYNKWGKNQDVDFAPILAGRAPTSIVLLSVFTHMYAEDIASYLSRISQVMTRDTTLLFTAFLFNPEVKDRMAAGRASFSMPHVLTEWCRYESAEDPLYAIAYDEVWMRDLVSSNGMTVEILRGSWTTGTNSVQFQDWLRAARPPGYPGP